MMIIETARRPVPAQSERDAGRSLLPPEQPLEMPAQDLRHARCRPAPVPAAAHWPARVALIAGASLLTLGFARELHAVLSFVQITPNQIVFLVLSTLAFGWIALGSLSAAIGLMPLFAGESPDTLELPPSTEPLDQRTALLFPVYHEDCARIAGTIEAITADLAGIGRAEQFDVFVLSDSRSHDAGSREEELFAALAERLRGSMAVYYRRRLHNTAKKAGNVADWVQRFGAAYDSFVVLDADSIMSGETLVRLALGMQARPCAGLIQTVPRLAGGSTLFQRLQQFAAGVYGPAVAAGLAAWHGPQGNYWGHNAIIRTAAFAAAAGLPELPGRPPFGGHVQSHDFVEAALMQRAGWEVHMAPSLEGSYEGAPPALPELVARDRRWAQGNLQHLAIVGARGLTPMGRAHLAMGASAYLVSAVWAASLVVGLVLALQGTRVIPSYFLDSKTLFPIWPVIDPGAAFRLFLATMVVVLMPKGIGLVLELRRATAAGERRAAPRVIAGVAVETLFSMLLAPILMLTQTTAVAQIFAGLDSGWKAQRRDEGGMTVLAAVRFHGWHMLAGLTLAVLSYLVSVSLMAWMAPVILGLSLSVLLSWWTARNAGPWLSGWLATSTDHDPPPILAAARARTAAWAGHSRRDPVAGAAEAARAAHSLPGPAQARWGGAEQLADEVAHAHR
ncbi:MAG: glucans biosynthesis glucosyltransferase MdoH [Hyphomicrobiaceae bacterium]|nr:glucans biosynthesis glucosyltransferase MdoH [Hyphomicrobiaceae bacterium]